MAPSTSQIEAWVRQMNAGDAGARDALFRHAQERLRLMARRMLGQFPGVAGIEQTDDVLQGAQLRLLKTLEAVKPDSAAGFFGLAARAIRQQLIDLARHYFGPQGQGANEVPLPAASPSSTPGPPNPREETTSHDPQRLRRWAEFHEAAAALPEPQGSVFALIYYGGLARTEAAATLGISLTTLKRRWAEAGLLLRERMGGEPPGA